MHSIYGFGLFKPLATDGLYLSQEEDDVYKMHTMGLTVTEIACRVGLPESRIKDIITSVWRRDSQLFSNIRVGKKVNLS